MALALMARPSDKLFHPFIGVLFTDGRSVVVWGTCPNDLRIAPTTGCNLKLFPHHPPPTTRRTPSTTTTTTTTMPPHFCKRKIFSSFQNETFADECPPGQNACFLLNCTSGTMPTKFVSVWGCMNYSTEACGINADKYGFSFANNDACYCALGHSNYNITSLLKKLELPEGKPSAAFTRCPYSEAVVMVVLMAVNLIIDFHIDA
ncbi:hypothetical protein niasHT_037418 [Heterodera trifolii]|uniref:Uncharacterized protein n=1 Tax=Heterodera trifolii TaxID=157864 RepID=A0ABD2J2U0_9BILA